MIPIDPQSRTPIYEQIVERFEQLIISGAFPPGTQMPSVRTLSLSLAINPNTIQKAYNVLEQRGYIFSVKGRGSFVSDNRDAIDRHREQVLHTLREAIEQAHRSGLSRENCQTVLDEIFPTYQEATHD